MTTITLPRATVEQALEVINDTVYGAPVFRQEVRDTITTLRAALAQSDDWTRCHHCGQTMPPVPLAQAEPDLSRCPQCNGPADNGFDRSIPPSPYLCTKCMAEPAQEPADAHTTTLRALLERCLSWEPDACVLGNVTAQDAAAALRAAIAKAEPVAT